MTKLVPVNEFKWPEPGELFTVTCVNHPTAVYYTKHIYMRGLHFIKAPEGFGPFGECPCPFSDLRVVVSDKPPCCPWGTKPTKTQAEPHVLCDEHWTEYWGTHSKSGDDYKYWDARRTQHQRAQDA